MLQGYNVQEADRMSVAIHPSETRHAEAAPPPARAPSRLRLLGGIALGGTALAVFTAGALTFFSGLADPRARPARVAPVASQWPDLKDGVPALSGGPAAEATRITLPPAEPPLRTEATRAASPVVAPIQAAAATPAPIPAEPTRTASVATAGRPNLPIEPTQTLPPARAAAPVTPAKVAPALAPSRAETVRAKPEQPARFVSLPVAKAKAETAKVETAKPETAKAEAPKSGATKPEKAEAARKTAARTRVTEATPADAPPARSPPVADDEPEVLGMKIPGGRQIRAGWDALLGGKSGGEGGGE
nr:hypothetical protein [Methylobacterium sp. Leaf118]